MLWNIILNDQVIGQAWFVSVLSAAFVKNALVIHNHYDVNIKVIPNNQ